MTGFLLSSFPRVLSGNLVEGLQWMPDRILDRSIRGFGNDRASSFVIPASPNVIIGDHRRESARRFPTGSFGNDDDDSCVSLDTESDNVMEKECL